MYPTALNKEYGIVEITDTTTKNHVLFIPFCTGKNITNLDWHVSSDDPKYGFDVYVVPSEDELNKWEQRQPFSYYKNSGCHKKNMIAVGDSCNNVSRDSGLLILMGNRVSQPLTDLTIKMLENTGSSKITSASLKSNTSFATSDSDISIPTPIPVPTNRT